MIADFLAANSIDGRIVSFDSDTSIAKACDKAKVPVTSVGKTVLFSDRKEDFFVVIARAGVHVPLEEACELFDKKEGELSISDAKIVLNLTGFSKEYFPPVSVFGVTVALHSSVKDHKVLIFALSEREFLAISPKEIIESMQKAVKDADSGK